MIHVRSQASHRVRSRVNMMSSLKDAIKNVERLENRQRKDHEITETVLWQLYRLEKMVEEQEGLAPVHRPTREAAIPEGPAPTVQDFHMEGVGNGRVVVTLSKTKQVTLPRTLGELTALLAADEGASPDGLVAWKSFDRVGEFLEKRLGRKFTHHALSQLLWRLRKSLEDVGLAKGLIERAPVLGARLRLTRRPAAALCAADPDAPYPSLIQTVEVGGG